MSTFFTSDLHFGHNREFIFKPRGFSSVEEMNKSIIERWNSVVSNEDEIYILGDLMLGDNAVGVKCIKQLNGKLHIIPGNHDSESRIEIYKALPNVVEVEWGHPIKLNGYHFLISHWHTETSNINNAAPLKRQLINLFGHTHSKEKFYEDIPFYYNVAVDAHDCYPVSIETIINDCEAKAEECLKFL